MIIQTTNSMVNDSFGSSVSYNTQLIQQHLGDEGYKFPFQGTSFITGNLDDTINSGRIVYDSDEQLMKVNNNGVYKEIVTSAFLLELTDTEIAALPAIDKHRRFIFDTTNDKLYFAINGTLKEIAS